MGWSKGGWVARVFYLVKCINLDDLRNPLEVSAKVSDDDKLVKGSGNTSQDFSSHLREACKSSLK